MRKEFISEHLEYPLISVIVPIYNNEKYIDRCIASIVNQTIDKIEILLVEDGSTDNSLELCKKWATKDNRIKIIHQENKGVSAARNSGLEIAKGKYIGFVDSDDYIEKEMYEMLLKAINIDKKIDLAVCDIKDDNNSVESNTEVFEIIDKKNVISAKFPLGGYVWNCIYKREIILKNLIKFDPKITYGEDMIFFVNYIKNINNNNVAHVKLGLYNYSITENSINNSDRDKKIRNIYNCYNSVEIAYGLLIEEKNDANIKLYTQIYIDFFFYVFKYNKSIPYQKEFIKKLKNVKRYFNFKQKVYYMLVCVNPILLYYIAGNFKKMKGKR